MQTIKIKSTDTDFSADYIADLLIIGVKVNIVLEDK